ncbi:DUF4178 domain-containing protein [Halocynthiibacter styelae]|uniref:DUF4178 domain-containing protein n=1 Tax=Halocynthiibacter styelae TaxID=2761955 RepID=A0A8J7LKI7_9RHOB|nr:DUF4178 domain-containing protein [Paenihalocynthiibacter styelae]MBI1494075.1 DUF4178 domain-containing protein [Paenihalocynthiibacter styelae]
MHSLNCPNCGSALHVSFAAAKMTTCQSCNTSLFLEGEQIEKAGKSGEMHEAPQLFHLGETTSVDNDSYAIVGHARFDYGPGFWDEYWALDHNGRGQWISVDEGIVILQKPVAPEAVPKFHKTPGLGHEFQAFGDSYRVTEVNRGTCVAVRGSFPRPMVVGEVFEYVNCLGTHDEQLSGEFSASGTEWFRGIWCDPFDVKVVSP